MEKGGTETESSGSQGTPSEATTSGKTIPDPQLEIGEQTSSKENVSASPDSVLQDAQHQLVLSLTKLVQNTIEKETKDLLRQIRDNSEHQTTLLKAALASSWCDPGQTAHIRAALKSQEPWNASDEALVGIQIGTNDQEVDETKMSYPLEYFCHDFGSELQARRIAMVIAMAVFGLKKVIHRRPESIAADLDALEDAMSRQTTTTVPDQLDTFFDRVSGFNVYLPEALQMVFRLKRGKTYFQIKPGRDTTKQYADEELANLMMGAWNRAIRSGISISGDVWPKYHEGLELLEKGKHRPEFGSIGIVHVPSTPEGESFMPLAEIVTTISQTISNAPGGFTADETRRATFYLFSFTKPWKAVRRYLSGTSSIHYHDWQPPERLSKTHNRTKLKLDTLTIPHTIRVLSPMTYGEYDEGTPISRFIGNFAGNIAHRSGINSPFPITVAEKRVSIWLKTSISRPHPVFRGLVLSDSRHWCHAVSAIQQVGPGRNREMGRGIRTCKWFGGVSIFQRTLLAILEVWHTEWNKTLDIVDEVLNVRLEDVFNPEKRAALMFEASSNSNFESSDRYFFVIEMLRISTGWIQETSKDLRHPQEEFNRALESMIIDGKIHFEDPTRINYIHDGSWKACADVIRHNWEVVFRASKNYEDDLLSRIERKTDEVKSLRDGLFSATSVKEATKSTQINEYILVFTIMTITYLPLGFVATLYGIDMFDFQMPGQTMSFAITTVAVSLTTYLAAWGLLYEVRQRRKDNGLKTRFPNLAVWLRPPADAVKHAFGARKSTKKTMKFSRKPDTVVYMDDVLPSEEQQRHEDETSYWKVIPEWLMGRRPARNAGLSV